MKTFKSIVLFCALALASAAAQATDMAGEFIRAIKQDNPSRVTELLLQGADPNTLDPRGVPGLYLALQEGSLKAARAIMASPKLNPDLHTPSDESVLMMAALQGELDIARALIAKGAQVNKPGWTPLHYAATSGGVDMTRLLLWHHAEVDARSPNGSTPLMMAARYGNVDVVQMLLRAGADPRARNQLRMDALDFATSANRPDAIKLLTEVKRRTPLRPPPAPPVSASAAPASAPSAFSPVAGPLPEPGRAVQVMTPVPAASAPRVPPPLGHAEQVMPDEPGQTTSTAPAAAALRLPEPGQVQQIRPASPRLPAQAAPIQPPPARPAPPTSGSW